MSNSMKNLIKLSPLLFLAGCAHLKPAETKVNYGLTVNNYIAEHSKAGARDVEVDLTHITLTDRQFLEWNFYTVSTNFYYSGGGRVEFLQITW